MKKKLYFLLLTFGVIFLSACGNNFKTEFAVESGAYEVGKDIPNSDYIITCEDTNYSMRVIVFESKNDYDNFQNSERGNTGQWRAAVEKNALYDYYLSANDTGYLSLEKGYIMLIESGTGRINKFDVKNNDTPELYRGIYFIDDDLQANPYSFSCEKAGSYYMHVIAFENKNDYINFHSTEQINSGQERAAIEQNALYDFYLMEGETGYLNLESGYVLLIDNGNGTSNKIDVQNNDTIELYNGVYFVDNDIEASQYLLTRNESNSYMQVTVFENLDIYKTYYQTDQATLGESRTATEQYALYEYYLDAEESAYLDLASGYVVLIEGENGQLKEFDTQNDNIEMYSGVYFVGNGLKSDQYLLTCDEAGYSMQVMIFENMDTYKNYHQTSRFTIGEENDAIEQNALYDDYIYPEETCCLNLKDGYVLFIDGGKGTISKFDSQDNTTQLYSGIYFIGDDLDAAQYSLKCIDSYMQVAVFENIDTYKVYHQASRFTVGEELDAVEQNTISNEYLYADKTVDINLQEGNILLIDGGMGELKMIRQ